MKGTGGLLNADKARVDASPWRWGNAQVILDPKSPHAKRNNRLIPVQLRFLGLG